MEEEKCLWCYEGNKCWESMPDSKKDCEGTCPNYIPNSKYDESLE